jgi:hypothetical protein
VNSDAPPAAGDSPTPTPDQVRRDRDEGACPVGCSTATTGLRHARGRPHGCSVRGWRSGRSGGCHGSARPRRPLWLPELVAEPHAGVPEVGVAGHADPTPGGVAAPRRTPPRGAPRGASVHRRAGGFVSAGGRARAGERSARADLWGRPRPRKCGSASMSAGTSQCPAPHVGSAGTDRTSRLRTVAGRSGRGVGRVGR